MTNSLAIGNSVLLLVDNLEFFGYNLFSKKQGETRYIGNQVLGDKIASSIYKNTSNMLISIIVI